MATYLRCQCCDKWLPKDDFVVLGHNANTCCGCLSGYDPEPVMVMEAEQCRLNDEANKRLDEVSDVVNPGGSIQVVL